MKKKKEEKKKNKEKKEKKKQNKCGWLHETYSLINIHNICHSGLHSPYIMGPNGPILFT